MSHPLTTTENVGRWMRQHASDQLERSGVGPSFDELAERAANAHPGHLDLLDLEDLALDVLEDLHRNPPGRARLSRSIA